MSRECSVTVLAQQASSQQIPDYSISAEQNATHKNFVRQKRSLYHILAKPGF